MDWIVSNFFVRLMNSCPVYDMPSSNILVAVAYIITYLRIGLCETYDVNENEMFYKEVLCIVCKPPLYNALIGKKFLNVIFVRYGSCVYSQINYN